MKFAKYKGIGNFILIVGLLLGCLYTLHDMQTAEGIGLFFAMQLGLEQRLPFDLLVDVVCIGVFLLLVYLPCKLLKHGSRDKILRLLIVYLAVMPSVSLAGIISLFREGRLEFLWDMGILMNWDCWLHLYSVVPFLQIWIPVLIILYAFAGVNNYFSIKKWHKRVLVIVGILLVILLIVPAFKDILVYFIGYLGLVIAFDIWETIFKKMPKLECWFVPFFGLLLLRGIFNMVVLLSQY